MTARDASHHWQVTVRCAGPTEDVERGLRDCVLPLLAAAPGVRHVALAACMNCAGEYTVMADWASVADLVALEGSEAYTGAFRALESHLSVAPKRELWRLLTPGPADPDKENTMTSYEITPAATGIAIELTRVGDKQQELLTAFGECQAGQCSCPTNEYEKVAGMELMPGDDTIRIELTAKPGTAFDTSEIAACLDYTVQKAGR